jgi:hypothetical protein
VHLRNALLNQQDILIHDLVTQATKTDNVRPKYAAAAISMLSHPLPSKYSLPSDVQILLLRLVDSAAENPATKTLKPVYDLTKGTSTLLLGLLSNAALHRFEEQLYQILRDSTNRPPGEQDDQPLSLYCLAIMKLVARGAEDALALTNSFYQTQDLLASTQQSPRWNAAEMEKYFSKPSSVPKTINLLALKILSACTLVNEPLQDRLRVFSLAADLMAAIPADMRDEWCAANGPFVKKLQQRTLSCDPESTLRLHAFAFIAQLCKPVFLQISSIECIRDALSDLGMLVRAYEEDNGASWNRCATAVIDSSTVVALLSKIMKQLLTASPVDLLQNAAAFTKALDLLSSLAGERHEIADAAIASLTSTQCSPQLQRLCEHLELSASSGQVISADTKICAVEWVNARKRISQALSSFLLKALFAREDNENPVSRQVGASLLEFHAMSARTDSHCAHRAAPARGIRVVIAEQESTPDDPDPDWRQALHDCLGSEAHAKEERLRLLFTKACADLEKRCEGIEEPLRQEYGLRATLQQQYDELQEAYGELESQSIDRKFQYEALETEKDELHHELEQARDRSHELEGRIEELEQLLQTAKEDAEWKLADAQKALDTAELRHATAFAKKEADAEDLEQTNQVLRSDLEKKSRDLDTLQKKYDETQESKATTELEVQRIGHELREKQSAVGKLEQSLQETTNERDTLQSELDTSKETLSKDQAAHENHIQQVKDHSKQNLEAANASHNATMDHLAAQHGEEVANLERQISDLQTQLEQRKLHHQSETAKREEEMEDAQKHIARLQRKCKDKDHQIQEANAMRANLMAAMGIGHMGGSIQPSLPHRTRPQATAACATQVQLSQSQIDPSPPTPASTDDDGMEEQQIDGRASFASHTSSGQPRSGPTPKRPRPRKSFKAPSPAKSRLSIGRRTSKRQPLEDMGVNRLSGKVAPRTPSRKSAAFVEDEFDDSVFDENALFANTPGVPRVSDEMLAEDDKTEE